MIKHGLTAVVLVGMTVFSNAQASTLSDYLIVGQYVNDTAVDVSNYELGRVSALAGSAPTVNWPGVGPTVSTTATYDGNVAITKSSGTVKLSDVDVYADLGIDCAASYNNCTDTGSNLSNSRYDAALGAPGLTSIGNGNGVNGGVGMATVMSDIATAKAVISALSATASIPTTSGDITSDTIVNLSSGLNVLDFSGTGGSDITVKANLIFQGGLDAVAVVLVNDGAIFKTSQGNLVIGDGGIDLDNVVIVSQNDGTGANFDLSNTIINGVALWDLGDGMSNMSLDNVTGCTQLVGDDVDIQNVRLSRCAFDATAIPVPPAIWLFGSALGLLGWSRRKFA